MVKIKINFLVTSQYLDIDIHQSPRANEIAQPQP